MRFHPAFAPALLLAMIATGAPSLAQQPSGPASGRVPGVTVATGTQIGSFQAPSEFQGGAQPTARSGHPGTSAGGGVNRTPVDLAHQNEPPQPPAGGGAQPTGGGGGHPGTGAGGGANTTPVDLAQQNQPPKPPGGGAQPTGNGGGRPGTGSGGGANTTPTGLQQGATVREASQR